MSKFDSYVICTSPRSGSTLLCKLLIACGIAGNPESYFHEPSLESWLSGLALTSDPASPERKVLAGIFKAAITEGSLDTVMFGLRLQRHSFDFFVEKLRVLHPDLSGDRERLEAAFGRTCFIHLTRRDKVEQAVSYVKAHQTGLWHQAPDGTELERLSEPQTLTFDPDRIGACVAEMTADDQNWEHWFEAETIVPLKITYEIFSAQPVETLREVLHHLGLDGKAAEGVKPGVAKLADATSRDWVARFRSERGFPSPG
jgi:trehalose 2-sulfotransferase